MGLRAGLDRLEEKAVPLYDDITLPNGTLGQLALGEQLDALLAALNEERHPLLDAARRAGTSEGFLGLPWAAMQPDPGEKGWG